MKAVPTIPQIPKMPEIPPPSPTTEPQQGDMWADEPIIHEPQSSSVAENKENKEEKEGGLPKPTKEPVQRPNFYLIDTTFHPRDPQVENHQLVFGDIPHLCSYLYHDFVRKKIGWDTKLNVPFKQKHERDFPTMRYIYTHILHSGEYKKIIENRYMSTLEQAFYETGIPDHEVKQNFNKWLTYELPWRWSRYGTKQNHIIFTACFNRIREMERQNHGPWFDFENFSNNLKRDIYQKGVRIGL